MLEHEILKKLGYNTVDEAFYNKIRFWKRWYEGYVKEFHDYTCWNGIEQVKCKKKMAGMAKKCAEDWADLTLNEKCGITLEGEAEQKWWASIAKANKWNRNANRYQEICFALGTTAVVVRVVGLEVNEAGEITAPAKSLAFDFVDAMGIFPLSWRNGDIVECAFSTTVTAGGKQYLYLQIHTLNESGEYDVANHFYDISRGKAKEIDAGDVPGYEHVPPVFHTHGKERLYVLNMPNIVNNTDLQNPMGISVFANAIDQLQSVDNVFSALDDEIVLGRKRVVVQPEATQVTVGVDSKGQAVRVPVFDPQDTVFVALPPSKNAESKTMIEETGGDLRIGDLETAMQLALNNLSMKVGLGTSHWKYSASGITTATEVISANSDEFRTLKKHEIVIEDVILELVKISLILGNRFCGQSLNESVEMSVDFDDSIIEDTNTDFERDCRMLANGTLNRYEFRMKWRNEDEETAKKNLPKIDLLDDTPPEE